MKKISKSILKGAREALAFVKKQKINAKVHKVIVPKAAKVKSNRNKLNITS